MCSAGKSAIPSQAMLKKTEVNQSQSHICNFSPHPNDNINHLDTHQVKKDKQEFTVKLREGDSFLMPQVFDNYGNDDSMTMVHIVQLEYKHS